MRIEHIGYMVENPVRVAQWYVEHLDFKVKRSMNEPPYAHFLADGSGQVMIEIYNNPEAAVPDYAKMNFLVLHLAFSVADVDGERERLISAGASPEGEAFSTPGGDRIANLRDPWGFAIQLCRRAEPMV